MTKFTAIILWPIVYVLDVLSFLLGFQTFKEARDLSNRLFKRIIDHDRVICKTDIKANSAIFTDN